MSLARISETAVRQLAEKIRNQADDLAPRPPFANGGILRNTATGELFMPIGQAAMSGAHVIKSNGLADGYEPPSTSLSPPGGLGQTVAEAAVSMKIALGGCPHADAEPVELSTGEVVAAVCPTCFDPLPPSFVGSTWKP